MQAFLTVWKFPQWDIFLFLYLWIWLFCSINKAYFCVVYSLDGHLFAVWWCCSSIAWVTVGHHVFTRSWKSWWTNVQKPDFSSREASARKVEEMPSGRGLCLIKSEDLHNRGLICSGQKTQLWILCLSNTIRAPPAAAHWFSSFVSFFFFLILPITLNNKLLLSEVTLGSKPFWNRTVQCNWWRFKAMHINHWCKAEPQQRAEHTVSGLGE